MPKIAKPYGPKKQVRLGFHEQTRTKQAMKQEADINYIVRQFQRTGAITHANQYQGMYGEFAEMDFQGAMETVRRAREMFETVPAEIRKRFGNDPQAFIDFATDEANLEAMRELGLAPPEPIVNPTVVDPPPSAADTVVDGPAE